MSGSSNELEISSSYLGVICFLGRLEEKRVEFTKEFGSMEGIPFPINVKEIREIINEKASNKQIYSFLEKLQTKNYLKYGRDCDWLYVTLKH